MAGLPLLLLGVAHAVELMLMSGGWVQVRCKVPADKITLLRDSAATHDGAQQALTDLERRVQPGDRVFVTGGVRLALLRPAGSPATSATAGCKPPPRAPGMSYVAMLGSDRKTLHLLFPNDLDARNQIAAGQMLLPPTVWRIVAGGPEGRRPPGSPRRANQAAAISSCSMP